MTGYVIFKKYFDKKVKIVYLFDMDDKKELIKGVIRELLRISKMYQQIEDMPVSVDGETDVSTREAHTIQAIGESQKISITQVAGQLGITKSAASQMVRKLAAKGFLLKRQAPHSNKEFELLLTPLGWKVFEAHERLHGKDFNTLVNGLTAFSISQIATLSVLMESIRTILEDRINTLDKEATRK